MDDVIAAQAYIDRGLSISDQFVADKVNVSLALSIENLITSHIMAISDHCLHLGGTILLYHIGCYSWRFCLVFGLGRIQHEGQG